MQSRQHASLDQVVDRPLPGDRRSASAAALAEALQAGVTATALPFSVVMILMCYTIIKALNGELRALR